MKGYSFKLVSSSPRSFHEEYLCYNCYFKHLDNIKNNDLIDKIKIVLANLCKNNDSEDIKIIKDALCPVVVVDMSMMHLALEKLASK